MSNGFEFFEGARTENQEPRITLRRSGQMLLTEAAVALLGEDVSHVQIGFNPKTRAVGIRPAGEGAKGRYRLRQQKSNSSRLVDGKRFFAHLGVTLEKARSFDAETLGEGIVGFTLPEAVAPGQGETETRDETRKARRGKARAAA
jgi:hypothetical protein